MHRCEELGLINRCYELECREATQDEILTMHTQEHIDILRATENSQDVTALEELASRYDAIYIHPVSSYTMFICETKYLTYIYDSYACKIHYF